MKLRNLSEKDAEPMLEWMHDDFVVHNLATDFSKKTIEDCRTFIEYVSAQMADMGTCEHVHMAVTDDYGEYMGTVSLKNIDRDAHSAEFAIALRKKAMGRGYGQFGMSSILEFGFSSSELSLEKIYWCVAKENARARRFYDKQGYKVAKADERMLKNYEHVRKSDELIWYSVVK